MSRLYTGQTLWCLNGETVIIKRVLDDAIEVEYRGGRYIREKDIIGVKLFTKRVYDSNSATHPQTQNRELDIPEIRNMEKYGYLFNARDFRPRLSESSIQSCWPTCGDATRFRRKGRKK